MDLKKKAREVPLLKDYGSVLAGIGTGLVLFFAYAFILALFIQNEYMEITSISYFLFFVQLIVSFSAALIAGVGAGESKLISGIVASGVVFVLQACIGILLFDGMSSAIIRGIIGCAIGCAAAVLLCKKANNRSVRRKKQRRFC